MCSKTICACIQPPRRIKEQQRELLAQQQLDLSDLHTVLGALPSWLSGIGGATEKLTWLNQMLVQVWV